MGITKINRSGDMKHTQGACLVDGLFDVENVMIIVFAATALLVIVNIPP